MLIHSGPQCVHSLTTRKRYPIYDLNDYEEEVTLSANKLMDIVPSNDYFQALSLIWYVGRPMQPLDAL